MSKKYVSDSFNDLKLFAQVGVDADNIGIGTNALSSNTGTDSIAIGTSALASNSGGNTIGIGINAAQNNTNFNVVAIGNYAGQSVNGYQNYLIGNYAGNALSGNDNVGIGHFVLRNATTSNSVGVGTFAMRYANQWYGTGIGGYSGFLNKGQSFTGVGYNSGRNNSGDNSVFLGHTSGTYNQADQVTALGQQACAFADDTGNAKNVANAATDVDTGLERITITAHGFGSTASYVSLRYTTTGTPIGGMSNNSVYQFYIVDANTLEIQDINISSTGTDTHTLTPQFVYNNISVIGYNAQPTASNQVMLGDTAVTEVSTYGSYTTQDITETASKNRRRVIVTNPSAGELIVSQTEYWNGSSFSSQEENVGVGYLALNSNEGNDPTAFGRRAMQLNTGDQVTGIGIQAAQQNTGNNVVAVGHVSGRLATALQGTYTGYGSGEFNTGSDGTFFGQRAGGANLGTYSTGAGSLSVRDNVGNYATGLGYNSMNKNIGNNNVGVGYQALLYGQGTNNTCIGHDSGSTFIDNVAGNKTFDFTDINITTDRITVTAHGFGTISTWVNLKYTQGTSAITGLSDGAVYQAYIVDANTLGFYETISGSIKHGINITNAGSGTGHTLTPQFVYTNITTIGANSQPTKSNQVVLGDSSVTEVSTNGYYKTSRLTTVTNKGQFNYILADDANQTVFRTQNTYWNGSSYSTSNGIGIGMFSLSSNEGSNAVAVGYSSGGSNTGDRITSLGYNSGVSNTADDLVAVGYNAGQFNTGSQAIGVGSNAIGKNTGIYSTGIGYYALNENTAQNSVGIGYYALVQNRGIFSTTIGNDSGRQNIGDNNASLGAYVNRFNEGDNVTALGYFANGLFVEDTGNAKNVANAAADVDFGNNQITITAHGFGSIGQFVNLKYTTTGTVISGFQADGIYQFEIISANIIEYVGFIFSAGTDTHTFTPQFVYTNSTAIGANAQNTASNQVVLGDSNVTEVVMGNGEVLNNIKKVKVSLTATNVNNIGTTPITAIAAPASGFVINVISAFANLTYGATAFDNNTLDLETSGAGGTLFTWSSFLDSTANNLKTADRTAASDNDLISATAVVLAGTDSVATGDSTVDVYITYEIVEL